MAGCCSWGVLLDSGTEGTLSPNNRSVSVCRWSLLGQAMSAVVAPRGAVQGQGRRAMQLCFWIPVPLLPLGNSRLQEGVCWRGWARSDRLCLAVVLVLFSASSSESEGWGAGKYAWYSVCCVEEKNRGSKTQQNSRFLCPRQTRQVWLFIILCDCSRARHTGLRAAGRNSSPRSSRQFELLAL